jgi:4-hydroxy-3-methylbut-2-enyl diphosphate reductase
MGQYDSAAGGNIYLIEDEQQVASLDVRDPEKLSYVTQTTLSMDDTAKVIDALRRRFPNIKGPRKDDICYATQNRQDAVKRLAEPCDLILVVGSRNSSNSNRLREIAQKQGAQAFLIDGPDDIDPAWLGDKKAIGITAGASAPEILVEQVVDLVRGLSDHPIQEHPGIAEDIVFSLPKALRP